MCLAMQDYATHVYRSRMLKVSKGFVCTQKLLSVCTHTCIASIALTLVINQYHLFLHIGTDFIVADIPNSGFCTHIFNVLLCVGHFNSFEFTSV